MGCKAQKPIDPSECPEEKLAHDLKQFKEKQGRNHNKSSINLINHSNIYKFENKGITNKGKLKPEDLKQFECAQLKIKFNNCQRPTIYEEIKLSIDKNKSTLSSIKEDVSLNSRSINNIDINEYKGNFPLDPGNFVKKSNKSLHDEYEMLNVIGRGAFGEITKIRHKINNKIYALKVIPKFLLTGVSNLKDEINILKSLDHPNILRIFEYFEDSRNLYLVTEYCAGGELLNKILSQRLFSENVASKIIKQILSGISFCHSKKIVHRDLKPENLLLENDDIESNLKIIDFGTAALCPHKQKLHELTGTAFYIAPEVIKNAYDEKCDIWSIGVILYILLSGKAPFSGNNNNEIMKKVEKAELSFDGGCWRTVSPEAINFIKKLMTYDPLQRPSALEALQDPWLVSKCSYHLPKTEEVKESLERLRKFRAYHNFQRAVLTYMAGRISTKVEEDRLRNIFRLFDINGDGEISYNELLEGFIKYGYSEIDSKREVEKVMQFLDINNNNFIDYNEFLMANISKEMLFSEHNLRTAFNYFDEDNSGAISIDEILSTFNGLIDCKSIDKIVKGFITNDEGEITYNEFKRLMSKFWRNCDKEAKREIKKK